MTNKTVNNLHAAIVNKLIARAEAAASVDNASLEKKFRTEAKLFQVAYAEALHAAKIKADFADSIAIYAMQKVRKLLNAAVTGVSTIDKYTSAIIHNAANRKQTINNKEQNASLCSALEVETMSATKDERLHKAPSTASTQSSSTRKALQALGLAAYDKESKSLTIDTESPLFDKIASAKK